ncbi:LysM peptidoglycan-binding domain-containing protein [uncultured Gimesia sp.]|uniref:LysM peptidoglycan-binding domain-containing protein n=1 Tax=uncultured Gimesia sp. TaxID=1678688 RepID=UPI00262C6F44|nr:LysM peptidoglycan-binding domain-containing protein [uncultured Gimesia sp.]
MTAEKKTEKKADEEDWGIEKPKTGIAIETKVGLCLIFILLSAFGLVVYQKINRPQENMAINNPEEKPSEETGQPQADDPFADGKSESSSSDEVENQPGQFEKVADNSGFSTPQGGQNQENPFAKPQSETAENDPFSQKSFENQSEPQQTTEIASNQAENGFQEFDPPTGSKNEFANPSQNEFQSEPATFDNPQKDSFSSVDQFAQQPGSNPAGTVQENSFNSEPESEFSSGTSSENSGLMKQPAENEFAQTAEGSSGAIQVEEDPFGTSATEVGQKMPAQSQPPEKNEFENFGLADETNSAQNQNVEEFSAESAQVKITDISSSQDSDSFQFSQSEPQASNTPTESAFQQEKPASAAQEFEQPQSSEFSEVKTNQNEDRFGDFRAEEFSAEQAESVTTVKRPAAAIDTGSFRDSEMTAEQKVPQARGLFDGPAPVNEVSTQKFGSVQEESFTQQPVQKVRGEYVVQNGENFWTISKKLYGSGRYFQLLAEINRSRVSDPRKMKPGLKLLAPDRASIDAQYQARHNAARTTVREFAGKKTNRKQSKPSGFFISQDGQPMYRIGSSDTLTDISQRHLGRSSRWYQIYQINRQKLQNPNKLQIGAELQLPYDASRVSLVPGNSSSR